MPKPPPRDSLRVVTDDRGAFRFPEVPEGSLRLQVRHSAWPIHLDGPFEDRRPRTVQLKPGAVIRGVVLSNSGDPVPNARISLSPTSRNNGANSLYTRTDSLGAFAFDRLPDGTYTVAWMQYNGNDAMARRRYRALVTSGARVDVRMTKPTSGSTVSGTILGAAKLPNHCYVTLIPRGSQTKPADAKASSDSKVTALRSNVGFVKDGRFEIYGVSPGSYVVYASKLGRGAAISGTCNIEVTKGQDVRADVTVTVK